MVVSYSPAGWQCGLCGGPNRRLVCPSRHRQRSCCELPSVDPELHVVDRFTIEGGTVSLRSVNGRIRQHAAVVGQLMVTIRPADGPGNYFAGMFLTTRQACLV